ncbi:hypothetical protein ACIRQP_41480 [Streptomyces sp. NPDC102274]|uniref:hypothetical protein n=1 Tax=Streptomyces sp. NPDC102274 TaxID=3366151 RepID=UPI0038259FA3
MKMKRALVALAMTVGAVGVPLATATSAQATQSDCVNYLTGKVIIGPKVRHACSHAATLGIYNPACYQDLRDAGMTNIGVIITACNRA